jgi:hypothetical protein
MSCNDEVKDKTIKAYQVSAESLQWDKPVDKKEEEVCNLVEILSCKKDRSTTTCRR